MNELSPIEVAKRYAAMIDSNSNDPFRVLHEATLDLTQQFEPDLSKNSLVVVARDLARDFIKDCLDDMTRAVPWDNRGVLKDTRHDVLKLARIALVSLASMDDPEVSPQSVLESIGNVRRNYGELLTQLNDKDRLALSNMRRSAP